MKTGTLQKLLICCILLLGAGFSSLAQSLTFNYTGSVQTYTVPAGVTALRVDAQGAEGGIGFGGAYADPGYGGRVQALLSVTPGQVLNIYVGGAGGNNSDTGGVGGFNGGGSTAVYYEDHSGGGGGGATDIRVGGTDLMNRIIVAGGGGGGGYDGGTLTGGQGGGLTGGTGNINYADAAATGGTDVAGGIGGIAGGYTSGTDGALGQGGGNSGSAGDAGGGGGGYYGGGGGSWGSGGGGSSYTDPTLAREVIHTQGFNAGPGLVVITPAFFTPVFPTTTQYAITCANNSFDMRTILSAIDSNVGDTEVYSLTLAPTKGTITGLPDTILSNGDTIIPTGIVYTPTITSTGTDTVSVTINDGTSSATTTIYITILPIPSPIAGPGSVCVGSSIALSDASTGGTWSSTNSSVASVDGSGTVYGLAAGASIISYQSGACAAITEITVNPIPTVDAVENDSVCNTSLTNIIHFTGSVPNTTYNWTNDNTGIGLVASGVDSIGSFIALNGAATPVSAMIVVTPTANGCTGTPDTFAIVVKPTPAVAAVSNQVVCNNAKTDSIHFSGSAVENTVYNWSNTTFIGAPEFGTGDIDSFVAVNSTNAPLIDTFTVTPVANLCAGAPVSFTITVNPTPNVNPSSNIIVCNGVDTSVTFSSAVSGTTYTWINTDTTIGLPSSGSGNIAPFVATNDSSYSVTAEITVTAAANGCPGTSNSFTIQVNPTPRLNSGTMLPNICNNSFLIYNASSATAGTNITWSRDTIAGISNGPATGTGGIEEILSDTSVNPVQVTYIYALEANGCTDTENVKVVVEPTPMYTSATTDSVCSNTPLGYTAMSSTPGVTFTWHREAVPGISNASASGSGALINESLINTTTSPVTVVYTDTMHIDQCFNTALIFVTVNPTPTLNTLTTLPAICDSTLFTYVPGSDVDGTTFTWSRAAIAGISNGAASGIDTISEILINTSVNPINVVYIDTLTAHGCVNTQEVNVTVNPKPMLSSTLTPPGVCDSALFSYSPVSATTGTTFAWVRPFVSGIPMASNSGTGDVSETLINSTNSNVNVTYEFTLTANGCSNTQDVVVTVHPTPTLASSLSATTCSGAVFHYTPNDSGVVFGTTYTWTRPQVPGITPASNHDSLAINETLVDTALVPLQTRYIFTLTANGCTNTQVLVVTVNPAPAAAQITTHPTADVCVNTQYQNFGTNVAATGSLQYNWTADNATIWATGTGKQYVLVSFPNAGTAVIHLNTNLPGFTCTSTNSYTVNVNSSNADMPEVIYYNGQFSCLQHDVDSYQWGYDDARTLDSTVAEGEINQTWFISGADFTDRNYWVITDHGGCMQKSYYNAPMGITNVNAGDAADVKVFPNPATNMINVTVNTTATGNIEVQVLNMLGQKVNSALATDRKAQLSVAALPAGCYIVECYSNGTKLAGARFIKN